MLAQANQQDIDSVLEVSLEVDTSFWSEAACAVDGGSLAHLFFSEELQDIARAKRICAECPVMEQCLEGALARKEPLGVWGGQLFANGKVLTAKRRRGRPPKNPRPEDEFVHVDRPGGAPLGRRAAHRVSDPPAAGRRTGVTP